MKCAQKLGTSCASSLKDKTKWICKCSKHFFFRYFGSENNYMKSPSTAVNSMSSFYFLCICKENLVGKKLWKLGRWQREKLLKRLAHIVALLTCILEVATLSYGHDI